MFFILRLSQSGFRGTPSKPTSLPLQKVRSGD
jgi:hypothetical protein